MRIVSGLAGVLILTLLPVWIWDVTVPLPRYRNGGYPTMHTSPTAISLSRCLSKRLLASRIP
jgi:hypothetical protein